MPTHARCFGVSHCQSLPFFPRTLILLLLKLLRFVSLQSACLRYWLTVSSTDFQVDIISFGIIEQQDPSVAMADTSDLNLDAPSDLQDIPDLAIQLVPPPEGTYPDK